MSTSIRPDSPAKREGSTNPSQRRDSIFSSTRLGVSTPNDGDDPEQIDLNSTQPNDDKPTKEMFQKIRQHITEEWEREGFAAQARRDSDLWYNTLKHPGMEAKGMLMRRLFCILRFGGLFFRPKSKKEKPSTSTKNDPGPKGEIDPDMQWRPWYTTEWSIATALSHGGRLIIQLPKSKVETVPQKGKDASSGADYSFWTWLVTGNPNGDLSQYVNVKTVDQRPVEKVLFQRLGATHSLALSHEDNTDDDQGMLIFGRKRVVYEEKTTGLKLSDTKILGTQDYVLKHHRHWGSNIPLGGEGARVLVSNQIVRSNGSHGHLYFYVLHPKKGQHGGLLVGLEGSAYKKISAVGDYHGVSAKSSPFSPTFGYKWVARNHTDLSSLKGPDKYDSILVDLSNGWEFLMEAMKTWRDEWVKETSLPTPDDPKWKEMEVNRARIINKSQLSASRLTSWDRTVEFRRGHYLEKDRFRDMIQLRNP